MTKDSCRVTSTRGVRGGGYLKSVAVVEVYTANRKNLVRGFGAKFPVVFPLWRLELKIGNGADGPICLLLLQV